MKDTVRSTTSLDLANIEESSRAEEWKRAAAAMFPGLEVHAPSGDIGAGSIYGTEFGSGELWRILTPPMRVAYTPGAGSDRLADSFSVMLQIEGTLLATQAERACCLEPNDICLIDGGSPFQLEAANGPSEFMFLRIPRHLVLGRYPYLEARTAQRFSAQEPGALVLRSVLTGLAESAASLEPEQCMTALVGATCFLGVPKPPSVTCEADLNWRARAALAFIDAELSDPSLNAARVAKAQGISRRRLDEILLQTVGTSLNAQIWLRRLAQAATDLADPRHADRTVTDIAFSLGFVDAAHFARSFKRRYQCSPTEWRCRA